ncbi:hypothetical protein [Streptomyces sp. MA15]|uniref:hypothetical protein n=1 Tax=Streptomyces sp. MA15 TaxID=3055061 RepID=UPI0025B278C8|nr:hypothetical protein [Streptomyces sp. MA15]MDN3272313.1 hypothetical protein [Streptomyces sp. MA15]
MTSRKPAVGHGTSPGGPAKTAAAIIASAAQQPAPPRLVPGSDAYASVRAAPAGRLADVGTQKESAAATCFPAA